MNIKQYTVVLVNLDPTIGSEINKTRPCVVLSPDEMNTKIDTLIVAPLTSTIRKYPTRVLVQHNHKEGMVALDQIRTIDKKSVLKILTTLNPLEIIEVKVVLKEMLID
jgi:mRNA interferase MazF